MINYPELRTLVERKESMRKWITEGLRRLNLAGGRAPGRQLHHLPFVLSWINHILFPCLNFLISKIVNIACKVLGRVPGTIIANIFNMKSRRADDFRVRLVQIQPLVLVTIRTWGIY